MPRGSQTSGCGSLHRTPAGALVAADQTAPPPARQSTPRSARIAQLMRHCWLEQLSNGCRAFSAASANAKKRHSRCSSSANDAAVFACTGRVGQCSRSLPGCRSLYPPCDQLNSASLQDAAGAAQSPAIVARLWQQTVGGAVYNNAAWLWQEFRI